MLKDSIPVVMDMGRSSLLKNLYGLSINFKNRQIYNLNMNSDRLLILWKTTSSAFLEIIIDYGFSEALSEEALKKRFRNSFSSDYK